MRIYKGKWYMVEKTPGVSGSQRWNEREQYAVSGEKIGYLKAFEPQEVIAEYVFTGRTVTVEDGHLKGYCPTMSDTKALTEYRGCVLFLGTRSMVATVTDDEAIALADKAQGIALDRATEGKDTESTCDNCARWATYGCDGCGLLATTKGMA